MSCYDLSPHRRAAGTARLSDCVAGQLAPADQFILWALRRRVIDAEASPRPFSVQGVRPTSGRALVEPALAAYTRFRAAVEGLRARAVFAQPAPASRPTSSAS